MKLHLQAAHNIWRICQKAEALVERAPKVLIARATLVLVGILSILCLATALAHFNRYLYDLRGWNNNSSDGDVIGEAAIVTISLLDPYHRLLPLLVDRVATTAPWILFSWRFDVLGDTHDLLPPRLHKQRFYAQQRFH